MKTAISIPDSIFQSAETLAINLGVTRNELYTKAIAAFVTDHHRVTEQQNPIYATESGSLTHDLYMLQMAPVVPETGP